ncbi:MAG TPA: hypothetical protein VIL18_02565 [Longimicrobiales bacterium]
MRKRSFAVGQRPGIHRAFSRRTALTALLAAAAVGSPAEAVRPDGLPVEPLAVAPGAAAAAVQAEAGPATGAEVAAESPGAFLAALDDAPSLPVVAAPRSVEFTTEREAPGARMRVRARGERCPCRFALPRRPVTPDTAPRIRHLELTHRSFQHALVAARAGVLSARSTAVPPPMTA